MRYWGPIFIILLFAASCGRLSEKERIQKIVEEWQGKQIILPEVMTDFLTGDTIDLSDADFTILTYVDSVGCTGCKMKLSLWNEYILNIQDITDSKIAFVMIVNAQDSIELSDIINRYSFRYPVYWDNSKIISDTNNISKDHRFQTFLLDRHRNIMAIGSLVSSSEMEKLYNSILSGGTSVSDDSKSTVFVSDNMVNIGNLKSGESKSRKLTFINQGNDTIKIKKMLSSCECVEIEFNQDFIEPHKELEAILKIQGDTIFDDFERTVEIYYDNFEYPTIIKISGNNINPVGR